MKRLIFLTMTLACAVSTLAWSQDPIETGDRGEKIKALRIAIFTEELQLNSAEATNFWPIYNDYLNQRERLKKQYIPSKKLELMSDAEVEEQIKHHFEAQQRDLDLEKDLYQKLRKVLSIRKIAKIPSAERRFREELLRKVQENRGTNAPRPVRPNGPRGQH